MDPDGYPEESELDAIRQWPYDDFDGLLDYVRERWRYADYGYWTEEDGLVFASTGGWSGNEDLIGAMMDNSIFWSFRWVASRRGGHFVFRRGGVIVDFKRWEWDTKTKEVVDD